MERKWVKYIGVILAGVGGFVIGFGYGSYFTFSVIMGKIANISGELVGWVPLIGGTLAKAVEESLYNFLMRYSPNVIPLYIFGLILLSSGMISIHFSREPTEAPVKTIAVPSQITFCPHCGNQLVSEATYCQNCGRKVI